MPTPRISRYNVKLYHEDTREQITVGVFAENEQQAASMAKLNAALMIRQWMMSRTLVTAITAVLLVFLFAACTSSTGGPSSPSLTCEQKFDRALERGVSYTEALGDYTQCLIDRGDTVRRSAASRSRDY